MRAIGLAVVLMAGCQVPVDPNDTSPPVVRIKYRGDDGNYVEADRVSLPAGGSLNVLCSVYDAEGVRSAALSFSDQSDSCTAGNVIWTGSYTISGVPAGK